MNIFFPKYAQFLVKQIYEMISHLKQFLKLGKKVPEYNDPILREILLLSSTTLKGSNTKGARKEKKP